MIATIGLKYQCALFGYYFCLDLRFLRKILQLKKAKHLFEQALPGVPIDKTGILDLASFPSDGNGDWLTQHFKQSGDEFANI